MNVPQWIPVMEQTSTEVPNCAKLMTMAQRELSAFLSAVAELFGPEQARLSTEDWLDELESTMSLPGLAHNEWRRITIRAAARLANRLMDPAVRKGNVCTGSCQSISRYLRPIDWSPCFWPNSNWKLHPDQSGNATHVGRKEQIL
jgi:hypothetical protein